jgi:hypothetical protein
MTKRMKLLCSISLLGLFCITVGCGGCGGVKGIGKENDSSANINMKSQGIKNDTTNNEFAAQDFDNIDKGRLRELITLKKFNDAEKYDEFNYERKILVFKDANTKKVIKEIDIVEANPFHKQGFKRRIEPDKENFSYFIMKKGNENKFQMRDFLPNEIFDEIPNDFPLVRAIATISDQNTADKYSTVTYQIEWIPDAYGDNGEWDGPGYGVQYVEVYNSKGTKIFSHKYSGTSLNASVSEDGKYVFNMSCLTLGWNKNIRYLFTVHKVEDGSLVYNETFQNCKHYSGNGGPKSAFDTQYNGYGIQMNDSTSKVFLYYDNHIMESVIDLKIMNFYQILENDQLKLYYLDGMTKIINLNQFFRTINLK